ncbi:MAG: type II toxin-antitoxin system RelE/ParE family toxin [Bacteroidales bacterium]
MVRQIIWTENAQKERIAILSFWNKQNRSFHYSRKLNKWIIETLRLICKFPAIGKRTNKENVRVKVLKDYLIIYEITKSAIIVLSLWDCRQNPQDLKRLKE